MCQELNKCLSVRMKTVIVTAMRKGDNYDTCYRYDTYDNYDTSP